METTTKSFKDHGIDIRILKGVSDLEWDEPTPIQNAVIPYALNGENIVTRARTGCGKTGAYVIPILQQLLKRKSETAFQNTSVVIFAPSTELCHQLEQHINSLAKYCHEISVCNISAIRDKPSVLMSVLNSNPDIVIATPAAVLIAYSLKLLNLNNVQHIVMDEADLLLDLGFEEDIQNFGNALKDIHLKSNVKLQVILVSATLHGEMKQLRRLLQPKRSPWIRVELKGEPYLPSANQLAQYIISAEESEKFLLLLSLIKFRLISGKSLIFLSTVNRCYKVKLFLEQFGIKCAVLNSLLPINCRSHTIHQFNSGKFDLLLVADEVGARERRLRLLNSSSKDVNSAEGDFDASRGIDYHQISNVINFDFPPDPVSYIHRVGRTARGNQSGAALTFVRSKDATSLSNVRKFISGRNIKKDNCTDENTNSVSDDSIRQFQFKMEEVSQLKYRVNDVLQRITKIVIKETRLNEIRQELLNSEHLKNFFQEHRSDALALQHMKSITPSLIKRNSNMGNFPDYLVPNGLKKTSRKNNSAKSDSTALTENSTSKNRVAKKKKSFFKRSEQSKAKLMQQLKQKRKFNKNDPLNFK